MWYIKNVFQGDHTKKGKNKTNMFVSLTSNIGIVNTFES